MQGETDGLINGSKDDYGLNRLMDGWMQRETNGWTDGLING